MSTFTHHILRVPLRPQFAKIDKDPDGLEKTWLLTEGVPYATHVSAVVTAKMSKTHKGTKLADFVYNPFRTLYVSERAHAALAKEGAAFEFYPMSIVDQKDRPVRQAYFLAHLLGAADCVDLQRSEYIRSSFKPELVHTFRRLVLDPARIPPDATIFRIKEQPQTMIVRSDLVERMRTAGIGGFELWELDTPIMI